MRTFVVILSEARTVGDFSLDSLINAGRIDLAARAVNAAFWISDTIRKDVVLYEIFLGPPMPPKTIKFVGSEMRKLSPDERHIALTIRKALNAWTGREWTPVHPGVYVARKGLKEVLQEVKGRKYVMDPSGERKIPQAGCFIIGDHKGFTHEIWNMIRKYPRISLGSTVYLASHCIVILNYLLDRRERNENLPVLC